MDSDQLKEMGDRINDGRPLDLKLDTNVGSAPSQPSARSVGSTRTAPPQRTSATVRSAAPNDAPRSNGANVHPAHSGHPQRLASLNAASLSPGGNDPVRKRHRNKDPYAIDMDDDDDDLLTALPKNKRQEESLMDFLNNNEPPKDNAPRPLVNGGGAQARSIMNRARTSSFNTPKSPDADPGARMKSMQSTGGPRAGNAPSVRSMQSGTSQARARPTDAGALPPMPKPKLQARGAGDAAKDKDGGAPGGFKQDTNDLADFLKNSGPPDDPDSAPAPSVARKSKLSPKEQKKAEEKVKKAVGRKGGVSGFFSRLKN